MKPASNLPRISSRRAFTLMEILVVIAIIIVIAAIAFPVYGKMRANANKNHALGQMRALSSGLATYCGQHDGVFPAEDASGKDTWENAKLPESEKVWYNAIPKQMGNRTISEFVTSGNTAAFYTKENVLWLPGANYPEGKKLAKPLFAIAINGKLMRKDKEGKKPDIRMSNIVNPGRTVAFLEQGLPGEPKAHDAIDKKSYDGSAKGSAKTFVTRYNGKGVIGFLDGHAEEFKADQIISPIGDTLWDETMAASNPSAVFWTADPKENPNTKSQQ